MRGASVTDKGKREPRRGNTSRYDGDIDTDLYRDNRHDPKGEITSEPILGIEGNFNARDDEHQIYEHDERRPYEAELFPDNRKYKIAFRKRKKIQFLTRLK